MFANRSSFGVVALWAALCVVLLACAWPGLSRASATTGLAALHPAATAMAVDSHLKLPSAPCPDTPATDAPVAAETAADTESTADAVRLALRRSAWVAVVPLWPSDALRWQRPDPALRLNPGHAPPTA